MIEKTGSVGGLKGLYLRYAFPTFLSDAIGAIEAHINEFPGIKMVVIDTLQHIRGPAPKMVNAYENDVYVLKQFQNLAFEKKILILMVHHLTKTAHDNPFSRISGSQGIPGACDFMAIVERRPKEEIGTMLTRCRDAEERHLAVRFVMEDQVWINKGDANQQKLSGQMDGVMKLLRTVPLVTARDVADHLGTTAGAARVLLSKMAGKKLLRAYERGKYVLETPEEPEDSPPTEIEEWWQK
jgi:hypothetical protein